jgi:imidazoleglycerol phosphate synthase glutamine amidotransferase subunit HisH
LDVLDYQVASVKTLGICVGAGMLEETREKKVGETYQVCPKSSQSLKTFL